VEIGSPVGCVPTIDPYFGTPPRRQVCIGQTALVALQASKSRLLTSGGHIDCRRKRTLPRCVGVKHRRELQGVPKVWR